MSIVALFIIATHVQTSKTKENPNEIKTKWICTLWYMHIVPTQLLAKIWLTVIEKHGALCPHPITEMLVSPFSRFLHGCGYSCDHSGDGVFNKHLGSSSDGLTWIPSAARTGQELAGS